MKLYFPIHAVFFVEFEKFKAYITHPWCQVLAILDRLQKEREEREAGKDGVDANGDDDNWDDIVEEDAKPLGAGQT